MTQAIDPKGFDRLARETLDHILQALDELDPDLVEAVPSDGVVKLEFQGQRRPWVVNSQSAAQQIWLAAEQRAWHFARDGERWVAEKTQEELFATLTGLLREHVGIEVEL